MNTHFLRIAFVSIAAATLIAPLTAQEHGRGVLGPAQRSGRGVAVDDGSPRPQAFSVSLVLGEMQATTGGADNVPAAARKALTDVKDFLPYKAYRLLDSQWTLCCGRPSMVSTPIVSRLRGPEEQDYGVEIIPSSAGNGKFYVHFQLWEPRATETAVSGGGRRGSIAATDAPLADVQRSLQIERSFLEQQLAELKKTKGEDHPEVVQLRRRLESLDSQSHESRRVESMGRTISPSMGRRPVIDTSFTMDVGETVVVGTSRLKGDKALIALLTAVPATKGQAK
jgi:hypothetical protein